MDRGVSQIVRAAHGLRSLLILGMGSVMIGCGGGGGSSPSMDTVPNVIGDSQATAQSAINAAGLTVGALTTQSSASVASGIVISQSPAAGSSVAVSSSVGLVVSTGPENVNVPVIDNDPQDTATSKISAAGLVVGSITTQSSLSIASGSVISSTPSEGTTVPMGSTVNLVISSGLPAAGVNYQISSNAVNDVVWEPNAGLLYLAIGSNAGVYPNSVVAFNPETGTITNSAFAGSEPSTLAVSDDGQYLYVGLRGANAIQRFKLPLLSLDLTIQSDADQFQPGEGGGQGLFAQEMAVAPGTPLTVAVARSVALGTLSPYGQYNTASSPSALEVFDDAVARPYSDVDLANANSLAWGADNTILYSASNLASGTYVFPIATGDGAFQVGPAYTPLPGTFPDVIAFATGIIYDNSASALDAATNQVTAIYTRAAGFASPDAPNNRISYASFLPGTQASQGLSSFLLSMFNLTTGEPVGTANIYNAQVQGRINRMVRWGTDGLALATAQGQLVVLSGSLIAPGGTDSPKGTIPGTNPIYTPIAAVSTVPTVQVLALQAADMVWDPTHGVIYASIPSTATANAGSILTINATTGAVTSQVTTAASPGPLAISDNGEYLYVGEPGAYQRFILPAMTVDISVTVSGWAGGVPAQLSVAPGNPHLFTASFNNPGAGIGVTALFQDAQQVGINVDGGFVAWGPSAAVLYDLNNNGGAGGIYTYSVSASGLTQTALGNGSRFVTLNPAPNGLGMYYSNGLLYADTGAIYNIATQNTNGTFSLGGVVGAEYGVGPTIINQASNRAFVMVCDVYGIDSVCGNTLMSFNLSTYVPVVYGPVQGFNGYALRIAQTGATTFAALDPGGDIALVSGPAFGQ